MVSRLRDPLRPHTHEVLAVDALCVFFHRTANAWPSWWPGRGSRPPSRCSPGSCIPTPARRACSASVCRRGAAAPLALGACFSHTGKLWYHCPPHRHVRVSATCTRSIPWPEAYPSLTTEPFLDTPVGQLAPADVRCESSREPLHADEPTIRVSTSATCRRCCGRSCDRNGVTLLLTSHDTETWRRSATASSLRSAADACSISSIVRPAAAVRQRQTQLAIVGGLIPRRARHGRHGLRAVRDVRGARRQRRSAWWTRRWKMRDLAIEDAPLDVGVIRALYSTTRVAADVEVSLTREDEPSV